LSIIEGEDDGVATEVFGDCGGDDLSEDGVLSLLLVGRGGGIESLISIV
jgi:hypothetical protein